VDAKRSLNIDGTESAKPGNSGEQLLNGQLQIEKGKPDGRGAIRGAVFLWQSHR
jgi:hypothetical protein